MTTVPTSLTYIDPNGGVHSAAMLGAKPTGDWVLLTTDGPLPVSGVTLGDKHLTVVEGDQLVVPFVPAMAAASLGLMRAALSSLREMQAALAPILTPELSALYEELNTLTGMMVERHAECLRLVQSGADHVVCTAALFKLAADSGPIQQRTFEINELIAAGIEAL